jgi:hypothetical protein
MYGCSLFLPLFDFQFDDGISLNYAVLVHAPAQRILFLGFRAASVFFGSSSDFREF